MVDKSCSTNKPTFYFNAAKYNMPLNPKEWNTLIDHEIHNTKKKPPIQKLSFLSYTYNTKPFHWSVKKD